MGRIHIAWSDRIEVSFVYKHREEVPGAIDVFSLFALTSVETMLEISESIFAKADRKMVIL